MSASDDSGTVETIAEAALPWWLRILKPVATTLARLAQRIREAGSFQQAVLTIVATWVASSVLGFGEYLIGFVFRLFTPVLRAIGLTERGVVAAFAPAGAAILETFAGLTAAVRDVTGVAGPVAPIIATLLVLGLGYVTYSVAVAALGELPLGSSLVDLLGLR
jgi:hypothetical protein